MSTYPVKVTLTSVTPLQFSFDPDLQEIPPGAHHVKWMKGKSGKNFKFVAVFFHEPNPFANVIVDSKNNEINADDDNHAPEKAGHIYGVLVKVDRTYYNSRDGIHTSDGPTIRNK